jgi:hypothetical protein
MRMKLFWSLLVSAACLCSATNLMAKSDTADSGYYTAKDKEFYLTPEQLLFIRPGLVLEILNVEIPADLQTEVTFKLSDPAGLPLDRTGIYTPGPVSTSFILAFIPEGEDAYLSYTKYIQTSPSTGNSAEQATTDRGGSYTEVGEGTYLYKFNTVLPADYDVDATTTLGIYARRDLTEFELDRYVTNELEHFVPSGMYEPKPRNLVTTETCNGRCHDPIAMHGGSRTDVGLCILCHNPTQEIDPDTGNSVDMPLMIHKIHMGAQLANGYNIIGYRQSNHDYSDVVYPAQVNECESCHTGGIPTEDLPLVANPSVVEVCDMSSVGVTNLTWGDLDSFEIHMGTDDGPLFASGSGEGSAETGKWVADGTVFVLVDKASGETIQELYLDTTVLGCAGNAPGTARGLAGEQHTNWLTNPSRKNCGSCHDWVNFETGEGHASSGIVQTTDAICSKCHKPATGNEFDLSIQGSHKALYQSAQFPGVLVNLIEVIDTNPGDFPTAIFSVSSKNGSIHPASMNRLFLNISGPNEDFDFFAMESVGQKAVADGDNWSYTFETALPEDAMGSYTLGVEGRNMIEIDYGHGEVATESDQVENSILAFAVTDAIAVPRREVVSDDKCESCHVNLSLHGNNRKNVNYCNTCHQPDLLDDGVRPDDQFPAESVHMKFMIHKIHSGAELENGYVVYGYRGSLHDYSNIEYTGDLKNCDACHVNNSQQIPAPGGTLPTITNFAWWSPMAPESAACLSCHDDDSSAAHAASNTAFFGESCSTCHGVGKSAAVDKVHAQ